MLFPGIGKKNGGDNPKVLLVSGEGFLPNQSWWPSFWLFILETSGLAWFHANES
jgi:hypothetical protein